MNEQRTAWGQTLFCDDIRYELGNKWSLIGIYQADMILNADFPIVIPKLVIFVQYYEVLNSLGGDLKLNIFMPHDDVAPSVTYDISRGALGGDPTPGAVENPFEVFHVRAPVAFSPLIIQREGAIKVRMHCGSSVTRLGTLNIRKLREGEGGLIVGAAAPPQPTIGSPPAQDQRPTQPPDLPDGAVQRPPIGAAKSTFSLRGQAPIRSLRVTLQITVEPPSGAVLLRNSALKDQAVRFNGPSMVGTVPVDGLDFEAELVDGAEEFTVSVIGSQLDLGS